jgi:tetratricopeptide (TPR) repeat protein
MVASPAQDLDALWDFSDPSLSESRFQKRLEKLVPGSSDALETQTQIARTHSLRGNFDQAHAILNAVEKAAPQGDSRVGLRLLLERGRTFNSAGKRDQARPFFLKAWGMGRRLLEDALSVDAAHMVAIVLPGRDAVIWNEKAIALAHASGDPKAQRWLGSLHNNLGWTLHDEFSAHGQALLHFQKALAFRQKEGHAEKIRVARWCVARAQRSLGKLDEALAEQMALEREIEASGAAPDGHVHEELALLLWALKRPGAPAQAKTALSLLEKDAWFAEHEGARLEVLRRIAGGQSGGPSGP